MIAKSLGVAFVTGASQGIGKAIAMRLASDGFKVALNDIPSKKDNLEAVARDIDSKHNHGSYVVPGDVSQEAEVEAMVKKASKALGGLDVMVANAGIIGPIQPLVSISGDEWDNLFRVNVLGAFLCYKYGARELIAGGRGGRIIGACSYAGKQGASFISAYAASKFAVRGLTQSAALELGEHGITVNAYAPGMISTQMVASLVGPNDERNYTKILPPYAKPGQPADVASIVSYLASKESHYITGQTISVNAGMYFD
ncbi:NAD(P)-binding protein [Gymnopus androsaceus JB14]|uniref:NAD(P)-binding protein n=1 Tax=Gymnopus androsaceus JB14 TaxID=1447944 RepID=A0A6A4HW97_9AGAR|nr:NAD(P)-binding protein [Gymnopus androsaceus JB14]